MIARVKNASPPAAAASCGDLTRTGARPSGARNARNDSSAHFLTQITRTTEVFAPADPPVAFTPLDVATSRTIWGGISTACGGATEADPATATGFSKAMPANLPSASSAAAPEKPGGGGGDSARSLPTPIGVTCALA